MKLNELSPAEGSRTSPKRVGRGPGSGLGKTSGRGHKGLGSRSGGGIRPGYEGGQMPIHRRLPKRGFTSIFKTSVAVVNVSDLKRFESGAVVDETSFRTAGIVKGKYDQIKLLAKGDIDIPITVKVDAASRKAMEKIAAAGGKVEVTA